MPRRLRPIIVGAPRLLTLSSMPAKPVRIRMGVLTFDTRRLRKTSKPDNPRVGERLQG